MRGTLYKVSDYPEPVVEVWEENMEVLLLFRTYSTQWRQGPVGPTGLDYNVFHHALDRKGITGDEFDRYIEDLQTVEAVALRQIHSPR